MSYTVKTTLGLHTGVAALVTANGKAWRVGSRCNNVRLLDAAGELVSILPDFAIVEVTDDDRRGKR